MIPVPQKPLVPGQVVVYSDEYKNSRLRHSVKNNTMTVSRVKGDTVYVIGMGCKTENPYHRSLLKPII